MGSRSLRGPIGVRLTGQHADDKAAGQLAALERWVEFVQGNDVKARVLAPVVPRRRSRKS